MTPNDDSPKVAAIRARARQLADDVKGLRGDLYFNPEEARQKTQAEQIRDGDASMRDDRERVHEFGATFQSDIAQFLDDCDAAGVSYAANLRELVRDPYNGGTLTGIWSKLDDIAEPRIRPGRA